MAYLGEEIKKLGFGLMRLPKLDDDTIDVEQTKNTAWINCKTREDATAQFETSLKQTGAGYFDFYLLHNLGEMRTQYLISGAESRRKRSRV